MLDRLKKPALPAVEKREKLLGGRCIAYTLKRSSKRRSIGLRIDDHGLTVNMPLKASERWLNEVLEERANWVIEKLDAWQAHVPGDLYWKDGEIIPYLGEVLTLCVGNFSKTVQRVGDELHVKDEGSEEQVEKRVLAWYRREALPLFMSRIERYAPILGVKPESVKLTTAGTQWGSCTSTGLVRLNVQLIKLPQYLIDYVIVHELAHLIEMNHSAAFWKVVEIACPDYLKLRNELKAVSLGRRMVL
jgi:predicted metal-dependent hydrolase